MENFKRNVEIRWSDLDPNFHVLHSKYYDFGAFCRMAIMVDAGITPALMKQLDIGAVLLREECSFRRELLFGDKVTINFKLTSYTSGFSRFTIEHDIVKNGDVLSAHIKADLAWIDTAKRKLASPPEIIASKLIQMAQDSGVHTGNE